jgi:hypothetical protein
MACSRLGGGNESSSRSRVSQQENWIWLVWRGFLAVICSRLLIAARAHNALPPCPVAHFASRFSRRTQLAAQFGQG